MRTLRIKLRSIRNMQRHNLMSNQILAPLQSPRNHLRPQIRPITIPRRKFSLRPHSLSHRTSQQASFSDLEPFPFGGVEGRAGGSAGRHHDGHGSDGVQPVVVDCCYVLAGQNGD